ncbi:unnamed protein product [Prorocentrum cordatum]|uniref:Uncharacterized protein n=1 Tax=Prorocentrum cordatum TaxID=2364126 RepID=A0ABN9WIF2_9DINO|nr:unnamed protein product [Polarella glacialis]
MAELQGIHLQHGAAPRPPGFWGQVHPPQVFAQKLKPAKEEDCGAPPSNWIAAPWRQASETESGENINEGARGVAKEDDAWQSVVERQATRHEAEELAAAIQVRVAVRGGAAQPQRGCGSGTRVEEAVLQDAEKDCKVWGRLASRVSVGQRPTRDEPPKERSGKQERLARKHEDLQRAGQRSSSVSIGRDLHRIELGQAVAAVAGPKAQPEPRFPSAPWACKESQEAVKEDFLANWLVCPPRSAVPGGGATASAGCAVSGGYEVEYTGKCTLRAGSAWDLSAGSEGAAGVGPSLHSFGKEAEEPSLYLGEGQESVGQYAPIAAGADRGYCLAKSKKYKKREKKEKIQESGIAQRLVADDGLADSEEMVHVASGAERKALVGVPQSLRPEELEALQNESFDLFEG